MKDGAILQLDRCPYCGIAKPHLTQHGTFDTHDHENRNLRMWSYYVCKTCGGVVMTMAPYIARPPSDGLKPGLIPAAVKTLLQGDIVETWPSIEMLPDELPQRAKEYLGQAMETVNAPVPSIIAASAAVDAMFKAKGLKDGSLYKRIEEAAAQHLITPEMSAWAHEVRLNANDQRHADEEAPLPSREDARKCILFAKALAEFLFVLPARVDRGRGVAGKATKP